MPLEMLYADSKTETVITRFKNILMKLWMELFELEIMADTTVIIFHLNVLTMIFC